MPLNVDNIALEQALERLKKALGTSTEKQFPLLVDEVIAFVGDMEAKLSCNKANKLKVTFEDGREMWGVFNDAYDSGRIHGGMRLRMLNDDRKWFTEWIKKTRSLSAKSECSFSLGFEDEMAIGTLIGCWPTELSGDENGTVELCYDLKKVDRWK